MVSTKNKVILSILTLMTAMNLSACSADSVHQGRPIVVAHRGGAALGMENSLSCIKAGIATGADMVEVDVHQTADGQLVVCHDATVDRTTNGQGRIERMTLVEVRALRLLQPDGSPSNETLPTLEEVLRLTKGRCGLLLEIKKKKHQYEGIEQKVAEMLVQYDMVDEVTVQSFNKPVLAEIHRLLPTVRVEMLSFLPPARPNRYNHIASFNVYHHFVNRRFVERAHKASKEVKVWTVDRHSRALRLPVDGVITNDPREFLQ